MPLPNFLIAGAPKCGTTLLYDVLRQHPEIGMSYIKEPNFFSDGWPKWARSLEEYRTFFDHCEGKQAIGEASPFYFYDPSSSVRIRQTLSELAKIVIIVRNPAQRAFSHWAHEHYKYVRDPLPFDDAIRQETVRAHSPLTLSKPFYYRGLYRYRWGSEYAPKVERYLEVFGQNNVRVVILEHLLRSPVEEFQGLFRYLGVSPDLVPHIKKSNAASRSRAPILTRLVSRTKQSRSVNSLYMRLPKLLKKNIYLLGISLFDALQETRESKIPKPSEEVLRNLSLGFESDIRKLESLLKIELAVWR